MQTSVNQEHGPDRRAVGDTQTAASSETTVRRSRSALARYASRAERCLLGFAHRRSLARSAASLSSLSNLPSAFSAVAARRHADPLLHALAEDLRDRGQTGSVGNLHRRQLQFGEKRGAAVGPTRRGKGSKIMAIADRHGLPVACCVTSASPHESKLVEATVAQRFTRAKPKTNDRRPRLRQRSARSAPPAKTSASGSSRPTSTTAAARAPRTAANCVATAGAGKSSASSPGSTISADSSAAGNITKPISSACSNSAASSSS